MEDLKKIETNNRIIGATKTPNSSEIKGPDPVFSDKDFTEVLPYLHELAVMNELLSEAQAVGQRDTGDIRKSLDKARAKVIDTIKKVIGNNKVADEITPILLDQVVDAANIMEQQKKEKPLDLKKFSPGAVLIANPPPPPDGRDGVSQASPQKPDSPDDRFVQPSPSKEPSPALGGGVVSQASPQKPDSPDNRFVQPSPSKEPSPALGGGVVSAAPTQKPDSPDDRFVQPSPSKEQSPVLGGGVVSAAPTQKSVGPDDRFVQPSPSKEQSPALGGGVVSAPPTQKSVGPDDRFVQPAPANQAEPEGRVVSQITPAQKVDGPNDHFVQPTPGPQKVDGPNDHFVQPSPTTQPSPGSGSYLTRLIPDILNNIENSLHNIPSATHLDGLKNDPKVRSLTPVDSTVPQDVKGAASGIVEQAKKITKELGL